MKNSPYIKKYQIGDKLIYIDQLGMPQILYFLMDLSDMEDVKRQGANYLLTTDEDLVNEKLDNLFNRFDKRLKYEYEMEFYYIYSKKKYIKIKRRYSWFRARNNIFLKYYNKSKYFSNERTNVTDTKLFDAYRNNSNFFVLNYSMKILYYIIKNISKIFGYPIIFIAVSINTSFKSFIDYKTAQNEYDTQKYINETFNLDGMNIKPSDELNLFKNRYIIAEKHFLESGKFISTLLLSTATLFLAIFINIKIIESKNIEIKLLTKVNNELVVKNIKLNEKIIDKTNILDSIKYDQTIYKKILFENKKNIELLDKKIDILKFNQTDDLNK